MIGAARGLSEDTPGRYFRALALRGLGRDAEAAAILRGLVAVGERSLAADAEPIDPTAPARCAGGAGRVAGPGRLRGRIGPPGPGGTG